MAQKSSDKEPQLELVRSLAARLPKFDDGRIDYTTSDVAPVINCIVWCEGHVLLLQRSEQVGQYAHTWSGVDGYIDRPVSIKDIVLTELHEELGIQDRDIARIEAANSYESDDSKVGVKWIVFPVLVELSHMLEITLDWEHTDYRWIKPEEIHNFDILPGQDRVLRLALELRATTDQTGEL